MADELMISCRYSFRLFKNDAFSICRYEYVEKPEGETRKDFIAKGNNLPEVKGTTVTLYGQWKTDKKGQRSFNVTSFMVDLPNSRDGVIAYFKFLKCGVGEERAVAIYEKFGENTWHICQNQPERLREVSGLSDRNIQRITDRLKSTRTQMEVLQMFQGSNIPMSKINRIVETLGPTAAAALRQNPYLIARMEGFSFALADGLALNQGIDPVNIDRRKAAVIAALDQAAMNGHTCLPREQLIDKMMRLLDSVKFQSLTREMCDAAIIATLSEKTTANTSGYIYTIERYHQEKRLVKELYRLSRYQCPKYSEEQLNEIIAQYEEENGIKMADSQKAAVICAVTHPVCVMTGGPGTGKSTTAKAILYCQNVLMADQKGSQPILLSPTGKAARRLAESTGYPATTIHAGIQLDASEGKENADEIENGQKQYLDGDIILVDESSMADLHVTVELVSRVRTGCKLVFIGDPDQLPSVGCGNVLADLIRCTKIPTVKLSVIFRQAEDNPIVSNSMRIMKGETDLLYTDSFVLMPMDSPMEIFKRSVNMYVQSVQKYGIESTILLCPYRNSTSLNVNLFNYELQQLLNPKTEAMKGKTMTGKSVFITRGKSVPIEFRIGDKVMQTVNTKVAKNGDTGFIKDIRYVKGKEGEESKKVALVEFNGDGIIHELDNDEIRDLDLAYCSTIHKSQGEEYKNVIMVMSSLHKQMLQRNLFYTGITRAKQNVLLVGEDCAVKDAILNNSITKRYTLLADRIYDMWNRFDQKAA